MHAGISCREGLQLPCWSEQKLSVSYNCSGLAVFKRMGAWERGAGVPAELCQETAQHLPWCGTFYLRSPWQKKRICVQVVVKKVFPNKISQGV